MLPLKRPAGRADCRRGAGCGHQRLLRARRPGGSKHGFGEGSQRLQLVRLHPTHGDHRFRERIRHSRQLRRVRLQRDPRDEAAHRAHQLRHRWSLRRLPRAPAPGRDLPEARQGAAAESRQRRSTGGAGHRALRPRQPVCSRLHVDHLRCGLQHRRHPRAPGRCAGRQLAHAVRSGDRREIPRLRRVDTRCATSAATPTATRRRT